MKTKEFWENQQEQLKELTQLRNEISKKIHLLKCSIRQHQQKEINAIDKTNTIAFQMFGKRLKDLTAEEYRIYYNTRQKINRQKRKEQER